MNKRAKLSIKTVSLLLTALFLTTLLLLFFDSSNTASAFNNAGGKTPTPTRTPTSAGPTPTLITGDLACSNVSVGVTCTNYGTYLDFYINKTMTTGGVRLGEFTRNSTEAYLGVRTNFEHTVTSTSSRNSFYSSIWINPYNSGFGMEPTTHAWLPPDPVQSNKGTTVSFINNYSYWNWFVSYPSEPLPENRKHALDLSSNSDYPITSVSIVGHIYVFSNQITLTGTPTATLTPTPTLTFTPTFTPTSSPTNTPSVTPTLGTWYTGNKKNDAYGVKAIISAPSQIPYLVDYHTSTGQKSGLSSWVSIPQDYWVQTGWRYYYGYSKPLRYIEYMLPNTPNPIHDFKYFGNQDWGTSSVYYLIWGGGTTWCAQVDNNPLECFDTQQQYAPIQVQAFSEVHASLQNELNTTFSQVYYLGPSSWSLFDQSLWRIDPPYHVDQIQYYEYRNYGP